MNTPTPTEFAKAFMSDLLEFFPEGREAHTDLTTYGDSPAAPIVHPQTGQPTGRWLMPFQPVGGRLFSIGFHDSDIRADFNGGYAVGSVLRAYKSGEMGWATEAYRENAV